MSVQTTYTQAPEKGLPGMLADNGPTDVVTMINTEPTALIPFGTAVRFGGGSRDDGALIPSAITGQKVAGIVLRSLAYDPDVNTDDGAAAGQTLNVLTKGRLYAVCENGCVPGDRLHVRAVVNGATIKGALRSAADGVNTIASTAQGIWRSTAAAGQLAVLDVDFLNLPG